MTVEIQGHRGARGLFPENTLEGFRAALDLGVRAFELDVGMTRDGVAVVVHDTLLNPDIARLPDGQWLAAPGPAIHALTLDDLARYDVGRLRVGSAYAQQFPEQRPIDGARIPTLAQVLALRAADGTAPRLTIEIKTDPRNPDRTADPADLADAVLNLIDAAGAAERTIVESFDWRVPRHIRHVRSDIALAWLTAPDTIARARLWWDGPAPADFGGSVARAVAAEGGPFWAPHHATLSREALDLAHALGLRVLPWTVNDPADMRRLIGWGVAGLITDRPDLVPPSDPVAAMPM